jgi:hypothetical protein
VRRRGWRTGGRAGQGRRWRAIWAAAVLAQRSRGGMRASGRAGASWTEQRQGEVEQRLPDARESSGQAGERCEELGGRRLGPIES